MSSESHEVKGQGSLKSWGVLKEDELKGDLKDGKGLESFSS